MADSYAEFGLPLAIFVPFSGVPKDQPDRIDREERLVRTIENVERHELAVRDNIIYLGALRKEAIQQDSPGSSEVHPPAAAAKKEALDAEFSDIFANLSTPAEAGKTLADFDSKPDDFPLMERPEVDADVEMADAGEPLDQSVQIMRLEASETEKKSIIEEYNEKTPSHVREVHQREGYDPVDAFYRNKAMDRLRDETEERLMQKTRKELKVAEWASPGRQLERLVEAAVAELEGLSCRSKTPFYQEALVRERTKNGVIGVRVTGRPPSTAPSPPSKSVHIMPEPKPLIAAAPYDSSQAHFGHYECRPCEWPMDTERRKTEHGNG